MHAAAARLFVWLAVAGLPGCQTTTEETATQTMNDASIAAAVQTRLTSDRVSNFTRVDVDAEHGIVSLTGVVRSPEQKARAEELARQVNGVTRVNNNLQVQSRPTTTGQLNE